MIITSHLLRTDFYSFVRKNFRFFEEEKLGKDPYIRYLCGEIEALLAGPTKRKVLNLPPRHLKTFIGSVCLPAFALGHNPTWEVMVVSYSHELAETISRDIRTTMRSDWYTSAFQTRIAHDHSKVTHFSTTRGGSVFASSIDGSLTGHGADLLICDDPLDIGQAENLKQIEHVNNVFEQKVVSRLNNRKRGLALVVAHRLNKDDLSAYLNLRGGWKKISLPMIAPKARTYQIGNFTWERQKGELLRPDAFGKRELASLRGATSAPSFDTLYQQDPGRSELLRIRAQHFQYFDYAPPSRPVVLSIDAGMRPGASSSYSVIQAWRSAGSDYYLEKQWRAQSNYSSLRENCWRFIRIFRPSAIVIEAAAMGARLIDEIKQRRPSLPIKEVIPSRSKTQRLLVHVGKFRNSHIHLPANAPWTDDYVAELTTFPASAFDDQVDATTQYLDFMNEAPQLAMPEARPLGAVVGSRGTRIITPTRTPDLQTRGAVLMLGSSMWRRF